MKKPILLVLLALASLLLVILGPDLLDLLRLQQHVTSSSQAYEANGGPWPQVSDACVTCHGSHGNSVNQHYPALAGQQAGYIADQLHRFAGGQRVYPIMNAMARTLSEQEIDSVAAHFAAQGPASNVYFEPDETLRRQGQQLVAAGACAACHGAQLMGQARFPRLAGQGYDYLLAQLDAFAQGRRRDPANTMNQLAAGWSPEQRQAIATFLASHPVAQGSKP